jgi:hypothetical protein
MTQALNLALLANKVNTSGQLDGTTGLTTSVVTNTLGSQAATALTLQSAGTTAVTIDTSQNVGIGTTTPFVKLQATGTIKVATGNAQGILSLGDGSGATTNCGVYRGSAGAPTTDGNYLNLGGYDGIVFTSGNAAIASQTERMRIDSSGNLLVGGTSVVYYSHILSTFNGATQYGFISNDTSGTSGCGFHGFTVSGTAIGSITRVSTTNAVAFNTTSDERLKSNITDAQPVLGKLMNVKVRQFDWTGGDLHQDYGFIAQELEPTLSGIVTKGKTDEDMWQLDYAKLTPHLVKAIQELKAINDTQAETINALTARVVALEAK